MLLWLAFSRLPVHAEEVLRLQVPNDPGALPRLMAIFPEGNYTFDRRGVCYVAGDDLLETEFPSDFPCLWLPLDVESTRLELEFENMACSRTTFRAVRPDVTIVLSRNGDFYALGAGSSLEQPACPFRALPLGEKSQAQTWVERLCEIDQVDGPDGVGMGGSPSEAFQMFLNLQRRGGSAVPFLQTILEEGSPAARLMACKALMNIGELQRAERGLSDLQNCKESVIWRSGCCFSELPASFLAKRLLEHPDKDF